ncbi:alpha-hydroxy-acid oxidizing protein [Serratia ureilytica]
MIIKGILDPEDAKDAVRFGADGIIVSNHGGRQLDGVLSTARAMPAIADAVKGDITLLADSGIRSGGRSAHDRAGRRHRAAGARLRLCAGGGRRSRVANLLDLIDKEMRVAMTLTGAKPSRISTPDRWSETPESKRLHAFRVGVIAHLADEGTGR